MGKDIFTDILKDIDVRALKDAITDPHDPLQKLKEVLQTNKSTAHDWDVAVANWKKETGAKDNDYICLEGLQIDSKKFEGFKFNQVIFDNCKFSNCTFSNTLFTHSQIVNNSSFEQVTFKNTDFFKTFIKDSDLHGSFQNTKIYDSAIANACIQGDFSKGGNYIGINKVITCSHITMEQGDKYDQKQDFEKGNLIFMNNKELYSTLVYSMNDKAGLKIQSITTSQLGNNIKSTNCFTDLGSPNQYTDYPPSEREKHTLFENVDREESRLNLRNSIYKHGFGMGVGNSGGQPNLFSTGFPLTGLKTLNYETPYLLSTPISINSGSPTKELSVSGTDIGLMFTGTGGKNAVGDRIFKYSAMAAYTLGEAGIDSKRFIPGADASSFDNSFKLATLELGAGTWIGKWGVDMGVRLHKMLSADEGHEKGNLKADGLIQMNDTYTFDSKTLRSGNSANLMVSYNFSKMDNVLMSLFAKAELYTNTAIKYASEIHKNDTPVQKDSGIYNSGPGKSFSVGVYVGF